MDKKIKADQLPRCDKLDGSTLKIIPFYTEAGYFTETNVIKITDGKRTAMYAPYRVVDPSEA